MNLEALNSAVQYWQDEVRVAELAKEYAEQQLEHYLGMVSTRQELKIVKTPGH